MGVLEQPFEGIIPNLERRYRETPSDAMRKELEECMSTSPCPRCHGDRLSDVARAVTVGGLGLAEFCRLTVLQALHFVEHLQLDGNQAAIARADSQGNPGQALFPAGCGAAVSHAQPQRRDSLRRREPADSSGDTDRLVSHGSSVYSG